MDLFPLVDALRQLANRMFPSRLLSFPGELDVSFSCGRASLYPQQPIPPGPHL